MFQTLKWFALQIEAAVHRAAWATLWMAAAAAVVFSAVAMPLLGGVVLVFWAVANQRTARSGTHGTARWAGYQDLQRSGCLAESGAAAIGRAVGARCDWRTFFRQLFLAPPWRTRAVVRALGRWGSKGVAPLVRVPSRIPHLAVFGASGSGKSTCFAIISLLQDCAAMVVMDWKGELYRKTARWRAEQFGHEIVVIDPSNISGAGASAAQFNPLSLCSGDERTVVDEARRLATALVVRPPQEHQPFFSDAATQLITCVIAFLLSQVRPEEAHLEQVRRILTDADLLEEMLQHLENGDACGGLLKRQAGQIRCYQGQTKASVLSAANSHLEFLDSGPVAETLAATSFDPSGLLNGRCTIYLCLPAERLTELQGLRRAILTSLVHYLFAAGENRARRIPFILDEAGSLGEIEALYSALVYGRSYGFRLMFLMQAVAQINDIFPESKAATFRSTTASVFCGVSDVETAEDVSKWIGQTTVHSHSSSQAETWSSDFSESDCSRRTSRSTNLSSSTNETGRALLQAEELLQAPPWAAVALLPGVRPIWLQKTPYYARGPRSDAWPLRMLHFLAAAAWTGSFVGFAALLVAVKFFDAQPWMVQGVEQLRALADAWNIAL